MQYQSLCSHPSLPRALPSLITTLLSPDPGNYHSFSHHDPSVHRSLALCPKPLWVWHCSSSPLDAVMLDLHSMLFSSSSPLAMSQFGSSNNLLVAEPPRLQDWPGPVLRWKENSYSTISLSCPGEQSENGVAILLSGRKSSETKVTAKVLEQSLHLGTPRAPQSLLLGFLLKELNNLRESLKQSFW